MTAEVLEARAVAAVDDDAGVDVDAGDFGGARSAARGLRIGEAEGGTAGALAVGIGAAGGRRAKLRQYVCFDRSHRPDERPAVRAPS
ncbi:MAG TPA: hypothetical protein VHB21_25615 [Minicystis sp.]|nr:hypothetical protein [Minicystis sp.]